MKGGGRVYIGKMRRRQQSTSTVVVGTGCEVWEGEVVDVTSSKGKGGRVQLMREVQEIYGQI